MPELALSFCVGAVLSLICSILFYYFQTSRYHLAEFKVLQENLKLINFRWNDLEGRLEKWDESAEQKEVQKAKNTYLLFSIAAVVLSWLGLFFLILMWVSL